MGTSPFISVVIPTYKRPDLLPRAIASVLAQTYTNWELIISDDEQRAGNTWQYLKKYAESDQRIRIVQNYGQHGQSGNVNNAMRLAKGKWIKPLFDDDVLRPDCLEYFAKAAVCCSTAAIISCRMFCTVNGLRLTPAKLGKRQGTVEIIPQRYVPLGMYLQEDVGLGTPTQVMVRTDIVKSGVWFEEYPGLFSGVDTYWFMRVAVHGDALIINQFLVEMYQGGHETVTSQMTDERHDLEFALLRSMQYDMIDTSIRKPAIAVALQMLALIRSANAYKKGDRKRAFKLVLKAKNPYSWLLFLRWLFVRKGWMCSVIPRVICNT